MKLNADDRAIIYKLLLPPVEKLAEAGVAL